MCANSAPVLQPAPVCQAQRRFEQEARITASLRSPHTVELYDFGVTEDGVFYYVMELLDGIDLGTLVTRFGPQSAARAIHILSSLCLNPSFSATRPTPVCDR
jgi:serine/threonine-protein kinase